MKKEKGENISSGGQKLWSSRYVFLMAAIGSAVGLANLWKFPYTVGEFGGGAFLLIYGLAVLLISIPVFMAELVIGRKGRSSSPEVSLARVSKEIGASKRWKHITLFGILSAFLTLSFYYVIAGWAIYYAFQSGLGVFEHADSKVVKKVFDSLTIDPVVTILFQTLFAGLVMLPLLAGFEKGIERTVKILMPIFFLLFAITLIVSLLYGDVVGAVQYLFYFDFSAISLKVIIHAVGQAFFSVGVGACILMVFGSKLPQDASIFNSALIVAGVDTVVALLAGLVIFPVVFAYGLSPAEGPSLLFVSIPLVFGQFSFGGILTVGFFLMVVIAALTSALAIALPPIAWLERKVKCSYRTAVIVTISLEWAVGLLTVFSFRELAQFYPLNFMPLFEGLNPFQIIQMLAINLTLPLGGLFLSIYVGWVLPREMLRKEMAISNKKILFVVLFCFRYFIPLLLLCLLISGMADFG